MRPGRSFQEIVRVRVAFTLAGVNDIGFSRRDLSFGIPASGSERGQ
ncbi:hypothetical protein [Streptomyces sp. AK02-01A]|nr:hypothetical protein [Streptomyces sp. AK02-01A]MDX3853696.1 hypothetical protein [Streptomyces sp. AK02-01A]